MRKNINMTKNPISNKLNYFTDQTGIYNRLRVVIPCVSFSAEAKLMVSVQLLRRHNRTKDIFTELLNDGRLEKRKIKGSFQGVFLD